MHAQPFRTAGPKSDFLTRESAPEVDVTLLVVYRRKVMNHYELVFGSDSRLGGGGNMDFAQKIFQLPRSDALFAFAGDTKYAYPLMMQLLRAVEDYPYSASRRPSTEAEGAYPAGLPAVLRGDPLATHGPTAP